MSKLYLFLFITFILSGCGDLSQPPPFMYQSLKVSTEKCANFDYAGIIYSIKNFSDKTIIGMNISFFLYDASTGSPMPDAGKNYFEIIYKGNIQAKEEIEIASNLDGIFWYEPETGLKAEIFHISSVTFDDGSVWNDHFGLYVYRERGYYETGDN